MSELARCRLDKTSRSGNVLNLHLAFLLNL